MCFECHRRSESSADEQIGWIWTKNRSVFAFDTIGLYRIFHMEICTFWHLEDLEHGPPPEGGNGYPRWILQINREVENERKPKNPRFDRCFTMCFHNCTKSRIWSYGRYAHSGIRVRPNKKKKRHVREKRYISQKQLPKTQIMIFHKSSDMV